MTVLVEVLQHGKVSGHGILDLSRGGLAAAEANYVEGYGTTCILHMDGGGEAVGAIGSSAGVRPARHRGGPA